jgi:hypothetical protein
LPSSSACSNTQLGLGLRQMVFGRDGVSESETGLESLAAAMKYNNGAACLPPLAGFTDLCWHIFPLHDALDALCLCARLRHEPLSSYSPLLAGWLPVQLSDYVFACECSS